MINRAPVPAGVGAVEAAAVEAGNYPSPGSPIRPGTSGSPVLPAAEEEAVAAAAEGPPARPTARTARRSRSAQSGGTNWSGNSHSALRPSRRSGRSAYARCHHRQSSPWSCSDLIAGIGEANTFEKNAEARGRGLVRTSHDELRLRHIDVGREKPKIGGRQQRRQNDSRDEKQIQPAKQQSRFRSSTQLVDIRAK